MGIMINPQRVHGSSFIKTHFAEHKGENWNQIKKMSGCIRPCIGDRSFQMVVSLWLFWAGLSIKIRLAETGRRNQAKRGLGGPVL
jgi:hypothetical protein